MAEAANRKRKRALDKLAAAQEGYHDRTIVAATKAGYISKVKRMQEVMSAISEIYELDESGNPKVMEGGVLRWLLPVCWDSSFTT